MEAACYEGFRAMCRTSSSSSTRQAALLQPAWAFMMPCRSGAYPFLALPLSGGIFKAHSSFFALFMVLSVLHAQ